LNRYLPSIAHIPTQVAMLHPMPVDRCLHFVHFPGVIQIIANSSIGLTLILRTYALYHRNNWVLAILFPFYLASFAVESWAVAGGAPIPLHPGFNGCILSGKPGGGDRIAGLWISQLVFPTAIFVLTTGRILRLKSKGVINTATDSIAGLMLRDGTLYFFVIFFINLLNVVTYLIAPPDLQAVNATFSSIMQGIMICRLMLNLRGGMTEHGSGGGANHYVSSGTYNHRHTFLAIGNLGADLDISPESISKPSFDGNRSLSWRASINAYAKSVGEQSFFERDESQGEAMRRIRNMVSRV